jgi:DNA-binding Xre family transcriptional regulator
MDYVYLKKLASDKGISLKSLAEKAGITAQGFHGYVKKNTMPINILEKIADELNVHLSELMFGGAYKVDKSSDEMMDLYRENRELRKRIEKLEEDLDRVKSVSTPLPKSKLELKK